MPLDYASRQSRQTSWRIDAPLAFIVLFALLIRLGWVLHLPTDSLNFEKLPDQREYLELGKNLSTGEGLHFVDPRFGDTVYAYRTPGYPLLIAICRGDPRIVRVAQAILDASTVLAVYLMAKLYCGRGGSLLAAALIAVDPFLVYFSGLILSETLFTAMLIWGMYLLIAPNVRWIGWLAGAIILALSVLVRPSAIALPLVLAVISLFVNRNRRGPDEILRFVPVGLCMLLLAACTILPWAWRNQQLLDRWIWSTTNSGITLYDGFHPDATGASDQRFVLAMPQLRSMNEVARSEYLNELAREYIHEHPGRVFQLAMVKIARTWSPMPLSTEYGTDPKLKAVALCFMLPFDGLIILGLWLGSAPRALKVFLTAPAVYLTVIHALSVGSLRYRIPADVPMAVLAASCQLPVASSQKKGDKNSLLATDG